MNNVMTEELAKGVWTILVQECGAYQPDEDMFVANQIEDQFPTEWRFSGKLGFGGKFWRTNSRWYVSCYKEDRTPQHQMIIDVANKALELLRAKHGIPFGIV